MAITLTDTAASEVRRVMESQQLEDGTVLRMSVAGGGCAGLQYSLNFDNTFDDKVDARYEFDGVAVVTRKKFALHLDGTTSRLAGRVVLPFIACPSRRVLHVAPLARVLRPRCCPTARRLRGRPPWRLS